MLKLFLLTLTLLTSGIVTAQTEDPAVWLKQAQAEKDTARFNLLYKAGKFYQDHEKLDSALYCLKQARELAKTLRHHRGLAMSLNDMGLIYRNYDQYDESVKVLLESLKISEEKGYPELAVNSLFTLALVYGDQTDFSEALAYNRMVLAKALELKDSLRIIKAHTYFGDLYGNMQLYDSSVYYLKTGIEVAKLVKGLPMPVIMQARMNLMYNLSGIYLAQKRPADAVSLLEPMYQQAKAMNLEMAQKYMLGSLSQGYKDQGQFAKALALTDELETLLAKDSIPSLYMNLYERKAEIYQDMRQYDLAYENLKKSHNMIGSIYDHDKQELIADMKSRYEAEKKDQSIRQLTAEKKNQRIIMILSGCLALISLGAALMLLRSKRLQGKIYEQHQAIQVQQKQLEDAETARKLNELEQMALQAQMNPHFIFNCLNSIQEFVIDKDVVRANKYISSFAHLIRQTLDASSRQRISLEEEIHYLGNYLELEKMRYKDQFDYRIHVDEHIDPSEIFIPAMLIQPFTENAIRHGILNKQDKGQLEVRFTLQGKDALICTVLDDGIGREAAMRITKSLHPGFPSKGMQLVRERIELLNKQDRSGIRMYFDDLVSNEGIATGTRVNLEFPLST